MSIDSSVPATQLPIETLNDGYLDALLKGDASAAGRVVDLALASGIAPAKVYLKVLMLAQERIGTLWQNGKVTISQEHIATQITLHEMSRLRQLLKPKSPLGLRAAIATISPDPHFIAGRVVSDFLYMDGWEVDFLGSDLPLEDLLQFVRGRKVDLVGLSVTLETHLPALSRAITALRAAPSPPKIMIGGRAVLYANPEALAACSADAIATDAKEAVEQARRLCGLLGSPTSLAQYLKGLGARILETRKNRKMSQQVLAETSGLDRAYISSVENGKQNLTIGAIFKLAAAMELPIEDLLVGSRG